MKQRGCKSPQFYTLYWPDYALRYRIYLVHDDAKEKEFELEMTWIGDETNGLHLPVPDDLLKEAEAKAKQALEDFE